MKSIVLIISILCLSVSAMADTHWELKKDEPGLKIYTGHVGNSSLKAVKAVVILNTSLSHLAGVLMDTKAHEKWVYSAKVAYMIKKISDLEEINYSEVRMPWPISDRDMVVHVKMWQDTITKVLSISVVSVPGYVEEVKGVVRIPRSMGSWTVTPLPGNQVRVDYIGQADPGGAIPAWVVNMFCEKAPFETFKKLEKVLEYAEYKDVRLDVIQDR